MNRPRHSGRRGFDGLEGLVGSIGERCQRLVLAFVDEVGEMNVESHPAFPSCARRYPIRLRVQKKVPD